MMPGCPRILKGEVFSLLPEPSYLAIISDFLFQVLFMFIISET
jgi:hypothetical protein